MPTYEYKCSSCGHEWEAEQRIVEDPLDTCPACYQKTARRQISAGNFILKGGGWYADLYSTPSKRANGGGNGSDTPPAKSSEAASASSEKSGDSSSSSKPDSSNAGAKSSSASSP